MIAFHEGGEFPFFPGERCCNLFKYQFCSFIFPLEKSCIFSYFWKSVLPKSVAMGSPLPTFLCLKFPKTVVMPSYSLLFSTLNNGLFPTVKTKERKEKMTASSSLHVHD